MYSDSVKEGISSPGRGRDGGQGQDGPCGSVYGGEDPGTLGCRGGPDRLCGRTVRRGLTGIRDTYSDAFQAIRVQRKLWPETSVCQYEKVRAFCALQEFFESGRGKTFEEILKPVESQEFLDTLATYFSCSGNLDQAAELLHAHKNTVKYRLGRIQTLTGLDLKKPEDNFMLYMAVPGVEAGSGGIAV